MLSILDTILETLHGPNKYLDYKVQIKTQLNSTSLLKCKKTETTSNTLMEH